MAENRSYNFKIRQILPLYTFLFINYTEFILPLQAEEIDRPAKYTGKFHRQERICIATDHSIPQRRLHGALHFLPFP